MKMISTPTAVAANQYPAYIHNCLRNAQCEPSFSAPLPGVPYLELYVSFGTTKPFTQEFQLIDICNNTTEQIFPSNFVVGQDPDGNWYGVFKYFNQPLTDVTTFVVWADFIVSSGAGFVHKTFFSELLQVDPCDNLMKIKACHPAQATTTGFDINGIYYGLPQTGDYLGNPAVRYFHIAWVRLGKVREISNKATFKSSLLRTFRSTIEKVHQVDSELVPKWYKNVLLAIYARGAVSFDDGPTYLVSDLDFQPINDDDLMWKPVAQLKETFRLYFGCDESECAECCSPVVIMASVTNDASGSGSASGSESGDFDTGDLILNLSDGRIFTYNFYTEALVERFTTIQSGDSANTLNKLFLQKYVEPNFYLAEWDLVLDPFAAVHALDYLLDRGSGTAMVAKDNATVYSAAYYVPDGVSYVYKYDLAGGIATRTNLFELPINRGVSGDILYNSDFGSFIITTYNTADPSQRQVMQFSSSGAVELEIPFTSGAIWGLFQLDGNIYGIDTDNKIQLIEVGGLTELNTIALTPGTILGCTRKHAGPDFFFAV